MPKFDCVEWASPYADTTSLTHEFRHRGNKMAFVGRFWTDRAIRTGDWAELTVTAGYDRGDEDVLALPLAAIAAGFDDGSRNFVPEHDRQRCPRRHVPVKKPQIGVTHTAAGDANDDFAGGG